MRAWRTALLGLVLAACAGSQAPGQSEAEGGSDRERVAALCGPTVALDSDEPGELATSAFGCALAFEPTQPERAVRGYAEAVRLKPDYAEALSRRADLLSRLGQHERALKDADAAYRLDPQAVTALFRRGLEYEALGDLANAEDDLSAAATKLPTSPEVREALNRVRAKRGEPG